MHYFFLFADPLSTSPVPQAVVDKLKAHPQRVKVLWRWDRDTQKRYQTLCHTKQELARWPTLIAAQDEDGTNAKIVDLASFALSTTPYESPLLMEGCQIRDPKYLVLGKTGCGYSIAAIDLLEQRHIKYKAIWINTNDKKVLSEVKKTYHDLTGEASIPSWPRVFRCPSGLVGGFTELKKEVDGERVGSQ